MIIFLLLVLLYVSIGIYLLLADMCHPEFQAMLNMVRKELDELDDEEFKGIVRLMRFYAIVFWPWTIYDTYFNTPDPEYVRKIKKELEEIKKEDN